MSKAHNFSRQAWMCALSTLLLNGSMGSLYAWSVFVSPLERELMVGRTGISFVFSVAVVAFTGGVAVAPYFYHLMRGPLLLVTFSLCSVIGLILASFISSLNPSSWWFLVVGYGALFGFGAGGTYSVSLQLINIALEKKKGLANGLGIGSFAAGSVAFSLIFSWALTYITVQEIFFIFGFVLLGVGITVGSLVWVSGFELPKASADQKAMPQGTPTIFPLLWLGFCCGAFAGLMAIGHAANFIVAYGGTALMITLGVVSVSIGNAIGRLCCRAGARHLTYRVCLIADGVRSLGCCHIPWNAGACIWVHRGRLPLSNRNLHWSIQLRPILWSTNFGVGHSWLTRAMDGWLVIRSFWLLPRSPFYRHGIFTRWNTDCLQAFPQHPGFCC